jgi:hypothetical protein
MVGVESSETPISERYPDLVPTLVETLQDSSDPQVQSTAARALMNLSLDRRSARAVVPLLESDLADCRQVAGQMLVNAGPEALPALREALKSSSFDLRANAAWVLGQMGAPGEKALPDLLTLLKDRKEKPEIRRRVANAIAQIVQAGQPGPAYATSSPRASLTFPGTVPAYQPPTQPGQPGAAVGALVGSLAGSVTPAVTENENPSALGLLLPTRKPAHPRREKLPIYPKPMPGPEETARPPGPVCR